jgi:hypothetical protein
LDIVEEKFHNQSPYRLICNSPKQNYREGEQLLTPMVYREMMKDKFHILAVDFLVLQL